MTSDGDERAISPVAKTLLASLPFILLAVLGLLLSKAEWKLPPEPVLASAELPDGDVLVHRAELGENMTIEGLKKSGGLRAPWYPHVKKELFGSDESLKYLIGNGFVVRTVLQRDTDRLKRAEFSFSSRGHEGLLLLVTARDAEGKPISSNLLRDNGGLFKVERNPIGILTDLERDKTTGSRPAYSFEVEDGSGGWLPMLGPLIVREADGRAFFSARVFPRTSPTLRLRATIGTEKPVVLEIPNPGYRSSVPALATAPAPFERDLGDVTMRLREAVIRQQGQVAYPWISWQIEPNEGNPQPASAYSVYSEVIEDEVGNSIKYGPILPGTRQVRVVGQVNRYSYALEDSLLIGEATWGDGKTPLVFTPTTVATESGVQKIVLGPGKGGKETTFWLDILAEYPVEGHSSVLQGLEKDRLCFFIGEEPLSRETAGYTRDTVKRNSRDVVGKGAAQNYRVKKCLVWQLQDGTLPQPGQTIRIGLAPRLPGLPFEFVLPIDRFKTNKTD
jgi:hypothetical protein